MISKREKFERRAEAVLRDVGITPGLAVLDCCCGRGVYTVAAAC